MPGLSQGKNFSTRIIFYHLVSLIIVLVVTVLAALILFYTKQSIIQVTIGWLLVLIIIIGVMSYVIYSFTERYYLDPLNNLQDALSKLTTHQGEKSKKYSTLRDFSKQITRLIYTARQQEIDLIESKEKFAALYSALQESEEYFKALFEQANEAILLLQKPSLRFSHFNKTAHEVLDYQRNDFANLTIQDIFASTDKGQEMVDLTADTIPDSFNAQMIASSGHSLECHVSAGDIQIQNKQYRMLMFHDISRQKAAQKELLALNSQLQTVLDASNHIAIIAVDQEGLIQIFNKGAEKILKYQRADIIGSQYLTDVIRECQIGAEHRVLSNRSTFERMVESMPDNTLHTTTCTYIDSQGKEIPVEQTITQVIDDEGNHHGYLCIAMDLRDRLAEQKRQSELESQLHHSQKMETIGTLAGGIAHDLNNLLTPVMGYTEMLIEDSKDNEKYQKRLHRVLNASLRAKELVKQILTFSHHVDHDTMPAKVKSIVREVLELMFASLPPNIQLTVDVKDPDAMINADVTKIHQVLMNLCTNAAHAIGDKKGVITIEIDSMTHNEDEGDLMLPSGKYVLIVIRDTGKGIPEAYINRIFEPFYTTKEIGEGTGLGLSVVHGILRSHNGTIRVTSKVNKGSNFYVYLPYHSEQEHIVKPETATLYGSGKRILIVDDDEPVLQLSEELLKRRGYQVDAFNSSRKALKEFKLVPSSYDVIITDQSMPEMTGTQLTKKIRKIDEHIPILLLTGLGNILSPEEQAKLSISRVIPKPVLSNDLIRIIYEVTEESNRSN